MTTRFGQPLRRLTPLTILVSALVLSLLVAACGGSSTPTPSSSSQSSSSSSSTSSSSPMMGASDGGLQVLKITEKQSSNGGKDQYSFAPTTLNVQAGDMVEVMNQSDEDHTLVSNPAGAIAEGNMISKNETQIVRFLKAGSFTITSREHPDVQLAVTVRDAAGALPDLTVVKIKETASSNGGKDKYWFSSATITVNNDTLVFQNETDEAHTLMSHPDGGFADGSVISLNETQIIHFTKDGTYTISSMEHPEAVLTVTVK